MEPLVQWLVRQRLQDGRLPRGRITDVQHEVVDGRSRVMDATDQPSLLKDDSRRPRRSTPHFPGCSRSRSTAATKSFTLIGLLWYASNPASVILRRSSVITEAV